MKVITTILFLLFLPRISYAFNYQKCDRFLSRWGFPAGMTTGFQFTSSTGACSALAARDEEKKRFFVVNYEKFRNEAAQGSGEHLAAFSMLSNCSKAQSRDLNQKIKTNYSELFPVDYREDSFLKVNQLVRKVCSHT